MAALRYVDDFLPVHNLGASTSWRGVSPAGDRARPEPPKLATARHDRGDTSSLAGS